MLLDESQWTDKIFCGSWRPGRGGTHTVTSPSTGAVLGRIGVASADDVREAAERAAEAQRGWAATPYDERARVLRRAGDLFHQHAKEIVSWLAAEVGTAEAMSSFEITTAAAECYESAALAAAPYGEVLRSHHPRLSLGRRLPVGVVGVIAPFNVPVILSMRAIAPALALGNAVVLKPDLRTAVSGGTVIARILEEAGLPAGVLAMLPGDGGVGQAVVTDPLTRVIAFTGSTRAGRAVGALAAQHLKRAHLELGGNSALVIFDDVDLDRAANAGAFGAFLHQGQICMASSRHLVQSSVAEEYTSLLVKHAEKLRVGDPSAGPADLGPIIDETQRDSVHRIVTESVRTGARVRTGGSYDGLFYPPTVLDQVTTETAAYREEIFGPVAPVVRFDDLDQVVDLAAGTEYGLSLGVLTGDVARGLELADRVPSGAVHINDQTINDEATIPFGGVGISGNGARHGGVQANLESFTDMQWVTVRGKPRDYPF